MKVIVTFLIFIITILFSGCYSVVSIQEEPEEALETTLVDKSSVSYFDEETFAEETDSSNNFSNTSLTMQEEETGFFESLIAEVIAGLSNISNNDDDMMMLICGDAIIYIVNSDNSSITQENSTANRKPNSTRNTGDRNYNSRK